MNIQEAAYKQAEHFLTLLDEIAETFTFQTFDDNADRKDGNLARVLNGTLTEHYETLKELQKSGAGVFVTVNKTDGKGRKLKNITGIRAVWVEDDNGNAPQTPVEPHISVESSPGKYHHYILVEDAVLGEFEGVQQCLVQSYGSDPAAADRARVLRLPGFFHQKADSKKGLTGKRHRVQIIHESGALPISWAKAKDLFPSVEKTREKPALGNPGDNPVLAKLMEKELYIGPARNKTGAHNIICPWSDEHSGDEQAQYFEPHTGGYAGHGFKCMHGHSQGSGPGERTVDDLLVFLGVNQGLSDADTFRELAKLSPAQYDRVREKKATELGIRVTTLDKEVAKARGESAEENQDSVVEEISPWSELVDGNDLLNELTATIDRYVVLPTGAGTVLPIWVLGSYCMDAWSIWPKLLITSPEKRCGKSVLMEVMEGIAYRALLTSNISPSAIFRCIEEWAPSLLIDEADTFAKDNDELNGIINSGHRKRTATIVRSEKDGDGFKPKKFSVWCPQAIAGIGNQRGTLHDRSIHIEMRRKIPGESSQKLPGDYYEQHQELRQRCLRWAEDHTGKLKLSRIAVPSCGNDRAEDNWHPIFSIAELVGGQWPKRVASAYKVMTTCHDDDDNIGPMILSDIRKVFATKHPMSYIATIWLMLLSAWKSVPGVSGRTENH